MRRVLLTVIVVGAAVRADVTPNAVRNVGSADAASDPNTPAPLLVVLHGNNESAAERAKRWEPAVERRGWQLLALDCPRDEGCDDIGRWYVWNGRASWVTNKVRELSERVRIDMSRVYLAGWSGGATYIGKKLPAWDGMFAGIVIHGGGVPPSEAECPSRSLPAYFLVGDKNPTHGATRRLRDYFERCRQDVKWDLVPGANHPKEDEALTPQKADEILRWLESHRAPALS